MQGLMMAGGNPGSPHPGVLMQDPTAAMRFHAAMQSQGMRSPTMQVTPSLQAYPVHLPFAMTDAHFMGLTQGGMNAVVLAPMGMNGVMPLSPSVMPQLQGTPRSFGHGAPSRNRLLYGRHLHPAFPPKMAGSCFPGMSPSDQEVEMYMRRMERASLSMHNNEDHRVGSGMPLKRNSFDGSSAPSMSHSSEMRDMRGSMAPRTKTEVPGKPYAKKAATESKIKKTRTDQKDKPKRPLSAYNCFFKEERARILGSIPDYGSNSGDGAGKGKRRRAQHGKISFEELGKTIGQRWQNLSPEENMVYKMKAAEDMKRYRNEMAEFIARQEEKDSNNEDVEVTVIAAPETTSSEDPVAEVSDHDEPTQARSDDVDTITDDGEEQQQQQQQQQQHRAKKMKLD